MILASEIKDGTAIQLDGKLYKVLEVIRHHGSGQMHGFIELKLKDMLFGHFADRHFKQMDKLENVELAKRQMNYLYSDDDVHYFMDSETFVQVTVPKAGVNQNELFLKENTRAIVELLGEQALTVSFPKIVELKVSVTGSGIRDGQDNTMKPATLENGIEIQVPQFIASGDIVRVDTEKIKYIDRVSSRKL